MKIFISSLITGMEPLRAAVREAIESLGHEPLQAEDFGALPQSPQIACLDGVRDAGLVVLVLGAGYGAKQAAGLSATHEEYREAKGRRPVIAFVQEDVSRDADETAFVKEVQEWEGGLFRGGFRSPEQLSRLVIRAIHEWEVSTAAGPVDANEILGRALAALPEERRDRQGGGTYLALVFAGGPSQSILRPSEIENQDFAQELMAAALFGTSRIFSPSAPTNWSIADHALVIDQKQAGLIRLDTQGTILVKLGIDRGGFGPVVVEEDIATQFAATFRYANWLLDRIDATQRLSHVAVAAALIGPEMVVWRTKAEQAASPNSYSMGMGNPERHPVSLSPPVRPRPALRLNASQLIEDLVTLLRREWKH